MKINLTNLSIVCSLGTSNDEVINNAVNGSQAGMLMKDALIPNASCCVGAVNIDKEYNVDTRYKSLLSMALLNLNDDIQRIKTQYKSHRIGIVLGSSNTAIDEAQHKIHDWMREDKRPDSFSLRLLELGSPSTFLKQQLNIDGPAYVISTACSSSAKAFQSARKLIENNVCDVVIVGGIDSQCKFAINGFHSLEALSLEQTIPLSANRKGINLGEGAALFIMEKDCSHSTVKNIELLGVGESSDAYHLTSPHPDGLGAISAMKAALQDANLAAKDIDYINMHGTGTSYNDSMESIAIFDVFQDQAICASTKSLTGHTLGASGAIELGLCWLMLHHNKVIPHVFDGELDPKFPPIKLAHSNSNTAKYILSNSFAFGGSNTSLIIGKNN